MCGQSNPTTNQEAGARRQEAGGRRQAGPAFQELTSGWKQPESVNKFL